MDPTAEFCSIAIDASSDAVAIRVSGEIDLASAPLLDAALRGVDGQGTIDVDVSDVTFCDGTGLRILEQAHRRFGSRVRVTGATPMLRRLAEIVEMDWLSADGEQPRDRYGDAPC